MKTKHIWTAIGIFLLLLIVSALLVWWISFPSPSSTDTASGSTQEASDASLKKALAGVPDMFQTNATYVSCMTRSSDQCMIEAQSFGTGVTIQCDDYLDPLNRQNCHQTQTTQAAIEQKNPAMCDELSENSDICKYEVVTKEALELTDAKLCNALTNQTYASQCQRQVILADALASWNASRCEDLYPNVSVSETTASGSEESIDYNIEMQKTDILMCKDEVRAQNEIKKQEQEYQAQLEAEISQTATDEIIEEEQVEVEEVQ